MHIFDGQNTASQYISMHHLEMAFYDSMLPREARNVFFCFFFQLTVKTDGKEKKIRRKSIYIYQLTPAGLWIHFGLKGLWVLEPIVCLNELNKMGLKSPFSGTNSKPRLSDCFSSLMPKVGD